MSGRTVLTVNAGSSSLKFSVYAETPDTGLSEIARASIAEFHHTPDIRCTIDGADHGDSASITVLTYGLKPADMTVGMVRFLVDALRPRDVSAIGHRVVHGGLKFDGPVMATNERLDALQAFSCLAPSHQPHNLAAVRALEDAFPGIPQTLSFDTAFHRGQPRLAQLYALPRALSEAGIIRFGFHGLSYAHIVEELDTVFGALPHRRLVVAHLGSGASASAIMDGKCVATTMGLTALDGLPMATRCGDLDPGVVLHLIQDLGYSPERTADLLYHESGLLGLSGISSDMRILRASDAPEAREALDVYAYRIAREIGSLVTALQGLDAIVFTGGVGENDAAARSDICTHLEWLGVRLNPARNARGDMLVSDEDSPVTVAVIPANEEKVIAAEALRVLKA